MTDYVIKPDMRILAVLAGLAGHFGRLWCFPSQDKICELLRKHHNLCMSRRTLNRHLGAWERRGYITRIRRHRRPSGGALELHSTVYTLKSAAVHAIAKLSGFFTTAAAHSWAKKWISGCANTGTTYYEQVNIMPGLPKNQAPPGNSTALDRAARAAVGL